MISAHLHIESRKSLMPIYAKAVYFSDDELIEALAFVKPITQNKAGNECELSVTRAKRLYRLLMGIAHRHLNKQPKPAIKKLSYQVNNPSIMSVLFGIDKGYTRIQGGDSINFATASESELKICLYVEGSVTEYCCNGIEAFNNELSLFTSYFRNEF